MKASVEVFSGKAESYVKYRGGYAEGLLDFLAVDCGLSADSIVADLGSGTGALTKVLLDNKNLVYAIEPNASMREMAERLLSSYSGFNSIDSTAEATTLPDASVDIVTAGRALQWFDVRAALNEVSRILKPNGCAVFIWNQRKKPATPLLQAYREFLRVYCPDFDSVARRRRDARELLCRSGFRLKMLEYKEMLNLDQLKGLVLSLSVSPGEGDPRYGPMLSALEELYEEHQIKGLLHFDYSTAAYFRRVAC